MRLATYILMSGQANKKEVNLMKLKVTDKWTDSQLKYFRKSAKKTEDTNETAWWGIFAAVVIMEVIVIAKIIGVF